MLSWSYLQMRFSFTIHRQGLLLVLMGIFWAVMKGVLEMALGPLLANPIFTELVESQPLSDQFGMSLLLFLPIAMFGGWREQLNFNRPQRFEFTQVIRVIFITIVTGLILGEKQLYLWGCLMGALSCLVQLAGPWSDPQKVIQFAVTRDSRSRTSTRCRGVCRFPSPGGLLMRCFRRGNRAATPWLQNWNRHWSERGRGRMESPAKAAAQSETTQSETTQGGSESAPVIPRGGTNGGGGNPMTALLNPLTNLVLAISVLGVLAGWGVSVGTHLSRSVVPEKHGDGISRTSFGVDNRRRKEEIPMAGELPV